MINMHPNKMTNSCFASLATVIENVMPLSLFGIETSLLSSTLFNVISNTSLHTVPNNFPLKRNHLWDQPNNKFMWSFMLKCNSCFYKKMLTFWHNNSFPELVQLIKQHHCLSMVLLHETLRFKGLWTSMILRHNNFKLQQLQHVK